MSIGTHSAPWIEGRQAVQIGEEVVGEHRCMYGFRLHWLSSSVEDWHDLICSHAAICLLQHT